MTYTNPMGWQTGNVPPNPPDRPVMTGEHVGQHGPECVPCQLAGAFEGAEVNR